MRVLVICLTFFLCATGILLSGCSIIKEGITGERQGAEDEPPEVSEEHPMLPAAFPIIGNWFGVYSGQEYLAVLFSADGKCELQPAVYASDMFGPRYFGEYRWGGTDGNEIILDLYKGDAKESTLEIGDAWVWEDNGRNRASTGLMMTFRVYGGNMKSVALKAIGAGVDTEGYTVVRNGALVLLMPIIDDLSYMPSSFIFGSKPFDTTEGKSLTPSAPDVFALRAERFYTTAELNVRCGPGVGYGTYGTVPIGTPVDRIAGATGIPDWAFVLLDEGGGWVSEDYLVDKVSDVPKED